MREVLLFSAGLDSFPAWHYLGKPPALYFDIRHYGRQQEIDTVQALASAHGMDLTISNELDLSAWATPQGDLIPFRNVLFAMLAGFRADVVWCVGVKGDHTADKSPEAFIRMSEMLTAFAGRPIRVDSPFWNMTKSEIVAWYLEAGLPVNDLLQTFSCATPEDAFAHCGRCPSCLRRWIALTNNDIAGHFASPPWTWDRIRAYYLPAMASGGYPPHRVEEFRRAMATVGVFPEPPR
ncbi:7-cyano-7-deazaguanine synthase [Micromonospora narathiwatensis]|uniref:7-cyano-7-deazaguanine synthase n=1 Tax=Micromonospora narathiwatensis TaxID=299146 RepID=A0A1A8ZA81_9ACTN|nr:7-cyano-7-deazaguanine synthase [Micromonospora narathiwatensis]SBT40778.1 7-cyano-7-deazaguanine synthase (queuosine biosynthesis) [Micromonospora narathiwatensis]